ncbi:unnamed protein product [Rhizopus stolonifer]
MAHVGHGPSKSKCPDCYGVSINTDLSLEKHTNKTVGEFKAFDENLFTSVACDDDEDDQDKIEPDTTAVIGHPVTELKLQAMVVLDYENFHMIPETEFKLKRKVIATTKAPSEPTFSKNPTVDPTSIIEPEETVLEVEHEENVVIEQEKNQLFVWTFLVLSVFYCSLSVCLRQFLNRRRDKKTLVDELELIPPSTLKEN